MTPVPGPQTADIFRRLRAWNVSSWGHGPRIELVRAGLVRLAEMATEKDGQPRPPVPDAGVHALADQLQVLATDAVRAGATTEQVDDVLADLARHLGLARH